MYIKSVIVFAVIVCCFHPAIAQKPIKADLVKHFGDLIAPPSTSSNAYQKAVCPDTISGTCNTDAMFKNLQSTFNTYQQELAASATGMSGSTGDMMKKMQDPEFQKKMASMSQEEKMKMAMEMAQGMKQPSPTVPESPQVTALLRELGTINTDIGKEDLKRNQQATEELAHRQKVDADHKAVEVWQEAEIKKLPVIHDKVMDYPDPKGVHRVKLQATDKHLAIVDRELKISLDTWTKDVLKEKQRYAKFGPGFVAIHYGDDAVNDASRQMLASAQTRILGSLQLLLERSHTLWNDAATWYEKKIILEKEKP